jgi:hypothetical protein
MSLNNGSVTLSDWNTLSYDSKTILLDGKRIFPIMAEAHYSRIPRDSWKAELEKMKAGGVDWVSTYVIWVHHEEIRGQYEWTGNKDLHEFVRLIGECGMKCVLRIGPWSHAEVRRGGFPDWLAEEAAEQGYTLRSNDAPYLAHAKDFYEQIAAQVKDELVGAGGPIVAIQIENEFGHAGGMGGEEGEQHMRNLRKMAQDCGMVVPVYTATGWGGAVTGEMLPVMGGYCEAPWDPNTEEIPPSVNYLFTPERNDHNIASDYGVRRGLTFDLANFPYLTAELGGGMQVTGHRRPEVKADDVVAMTVAKLGSGANLLGYYMYHGGTNPDGHLTSLEETVAVDHTSDLPEKSYDFQAPIREYGQLNGSWRGIRTIARFVHDFEEEICETSFVQQGEVPEYSDRKTLRTAVRAAEDGKSGFFFVNNYLRHYPMDAHPGPHLQAVGADGTTLVDFGTYDVNTGDYFFWPFGLKLGESTLKKAKVTPLMKLAGAEPTYVFYGDNEPEYDWEGTPAKVLHLSRSEAWRACKWGEDHVLISDESSDLIVREDGSVVCYSRKRNDDHVRFAVYPDLGKAPEGFARKSADDRGLVTYESTEALANTSSAELKLIQPSDGSSNAVYELVVENLKASDEVYVNMNYAGYSAQLWKDGKKIADDFYIEGKWQIGARLLAGPDADTFTAELRVQPLKAGQKVYIYRWPELKSGFAAEATSVTTEAVYAKEIL